MIDEKDYEYDYSHDPDERYTGEWDADESDDVERLIELEDLEDCYYSNLIEFDAFDDSRHRPFDTMP
jgi:hypothetical protein